MARVSFRITSDAARQKATQAASQAPLGAVVTVRGSTRTEDQNDAMWPMLRDISKQLQWEGQDWSEYDWKDFFMDALNSEVGREQRWMKREGPGYLPLGRRTTENTVPEQSDLLEIIQEFGARHGVKFGKREPKEKAA